MRPTLSKTRIARRAVAWFAAVGVSLAATLGGPTAGLSPAEALTSFETEPGLQVELVAAEPLVVDPVALAFDEHGRLFVAENRGYPTGSPDGQPMGRIALLEDTNGDGRMDRRSDFANGLTFPNGVMPWRGGVIVTCAPDVYWFKDADGDGHAEIQEVLLTGFATNASTQLRVNDPTLGPDGWVYLAGGLSGGKISAPRAPGREPLDLSRNDLRFRPDTGEMALTDGKSQFGLAFDDAGHRFACYNRVQSQHAVLPFRFLARFPEAQSPGALQDCPADMVRNTLMRGEGSASRTYPISSNITTADSHAGTYSAACAVHIARGDALPTDYVGRAWSCDPTGNLVRSDRLDPDGATFAARRVLDHTEALRSRDNWFRPCFLADGPDGALYVADMYREVIEHPEYLPEEVRKRTSFEGGKDLGRVWRIRGEKPKAQSSKLKMDSATTAELVAALGSPNGWMRDTAFRLLVERRPAGAPELLLATLPKLTGQDSELTKRHRDNEDIPGNASAAGRINALNLLALFANWNETTFAEAAKASKSFPGLEEKLAMPLLGALVATSLDESPAVRETAFRLLGLAPGLSIADDLVKFWADDPNPRARFQCALMLGSWDISGALDALGRIALRDGADRWTRAAILSGLKGRQLEFLDRLMQDPAGLPPATFMRELGRLLGPTGTPNDLGQRHWTWSGGPGNDWKLAFWSGVAEGLRTAEKPTAVGELPARVGLDPRRLAELKAIAVDTLGDSFKPVAARLPALAFLREFGGDSVADRGRILNLVFAGEPAELQLEAVRVLARPGPLNSATNLLEAQFWQRLPPALRTAMIGALLVHPDNYPALLDAFESGAVPAGNLSPGQREQLRKTANDTLRTRAEKLFTDAVPGDRRAALDAARAALGLKPVPADGHGVFTRLCASCHRFNREGYAVGPDLFDIRRQSKETILLHLVIPEQEIAPNFTAYTCETKDGRTLNGLIVSESPGSVTLRQAQGLEETVVREQIKSLAANRLSLMPQELEKSLTLQELSDLLAYLRGE